MLRHIFEPTPIARLYHPRSPTVEIIPDHNVTVRIGALASTVSDDAMGFAEPTYSHIALAAMRQTLTLYAERVEVIL